MDWYYILLIILLAPIAFWLLSWLYFILFLILGRRLFKLDYKHPVVHRARRLLLFITKLTFNLRYKMENLEILPKSDFVMFANHQSIIDPLVLVGELSDRYISGIAKDTIWNYPIINKWFDIVRVLPLNRNNDREGAKTMIKAIKQAKEGQPMFIFPEGTRSRRTELLPFRDGAFRLATKSKKDIYLAVFHNFGTHKFIRFKPDNKKLEFYGPIKYDDFKDMTTTELSNYVREIISIKLG